MEDRNVVSSSLISTGSRHFVDRSQEDFNMFSLSRWFILAVSLVIISAASRAQTLDSDANTICNFDPNKQLAVEYRRVDLAPRKKALGNSIPYGNVWAPGGKPLTLFANTPFSVGGKDISDGPTRCSSFRKKSLGPSSFREVPTPAANTTRRGYCEDSDAVRHAPAAGTGLYSLFCARCNRSMQSSLGSRKGPRLGGL